MTSKIRALILSAGFGTRLRPLTNKIPKCLVKINGEPLLAHWLKTLESINCEATLINTHYLADKVERFISSYLTKTMRIESVYERELLGTLGTLLKNKSWFVNKTGLLIHGDNITNANFREFIQAHSKRPKECILTMMTFETATPKSCGIVETDKNGIMINFHEKVKNPPSNIANGAIYLFDYSFLEWLEKKQIKGNDISYDLLPLLKNKIQTWHTKEVFLDIGTPNSLKKAREIFQKKF